MKLNLLEEGVPQDFFSENYALARSRFKDSVLKAGGKLESLPLTARGPEGEALGIDIGWFGSPKPERILLHTSGIHGVEGFAGSAIQLQLIGDLPALPKDSALVLVHILNPYGMAWLRRVNEGNVDLNRNFLGRDSYSGVPKAYAMLDPFLNPKTPPSFEAYRLKLLSLVLRHGRSALLQAVAGGQYEFPKGIFFGGKGVEEGPRLYQGFLAQRLQGVRQIVWIDVHTGLGKSGEDSLLVQNADFERLKTEFGERVRPLSPSRGPAYAVRGAMESLLPWVAPQAKSSFLTQEFGTYGNVRVLGALRAENRWHHYGKGHIDHPSKRDLKEAFFPNSEAWKQRILARGKNLFEQALSALTVAERAF